MTGPGEPGGHTVRTLGEAYFQARCAAAPFMATNLGLPGYASLVPDPSREAGDALRSRYAQLDAELSQVDPAGLPDSDRISHAMLRRLLADSQASLQHGLHEFAISATMMGRLAEVVAAVPAAPVTTPEAAEDYLTRLSRLGGYFDALARRHRQAAADGRYPTAIGVAQAVAQLDGYLATPIDRDPLLKPQPGPQVAAAQWRTRAAELIETVVRPALARYRATLADELAPVGRPPDRVGVCHVPGGQEGYLAQVRAHTTTDLLPEQIHETGRELVAQLREEFAELGERALGTTDVATVLDRLRDDPTLRFSDEPEIVATAEGALRRAVEALPAAFVDYQLAPCVVRPMDPVEARDSVLGYYQPPAVDGSRPGAHVINTYQPASRPRFEYEALAFHESVPGHHLQFAIGQSLADLPSFRRFAYVAAYSEGWALYTERLCDELGLYSNELSRLGMVSFDAWRACRLVVDTGMHYHGWSRARAIDYLRAHTALSESNIANEVDRYIAQPGQALAYMIGRLRIRELRQHQQQRLGAAFDLRTFHDRLLRVGSVPLDTLAGLFA